MDWVQSLFSLLSAVVGGALVLLGERLRSRDETKGRRAETIISLYTDFFVTFQIALHHEEGYWSGKAFEARGEGTFTDSEKARDARSSSEAAFREAAWRLRLRVRDKVQQERIENLARAFDDDFDFHEIDIIALDYPDMAKNLRASAHEIVERMQELHRDTLDLI